MELVDLVVPAHDLEGHPPRSLLLGLPDNAHAAAAEPVEDPESRNCGGSTLARRPGLADGPEMSRQTRRSSVVRGFAVIVVLSLRVVVHGSAFVDRYLALSEIGFQ